jgi:hypothetical protein
MVKTKQRWYNNIVYRNHIEIVKLFLKFGLNLQGNMLKIETVYDWTQPNYRC